MSSKPTGSQAACGLKYCYDDRPVEATEKGLKFLRSEIKKPDF